VPDAGAMTGAHLVLAPAAYRLAGRTLSEAEVAAIALAVAMGALVPGRAWRVGRLAVTAVHEGGHTAVAVLTGRTVTAVHLRADTSGATFHRGGRGWSSRLATAVAGYPAPALAGVAGAWLTAHHHSRVWLGVLAGLGALNLVLWVRNLFGVALMLAVVGGLGWLAHSGTSGVDGLVGAVIAWYLAIGGLRSVVEAFGFAGPSDASELGQLTHLPAVVWKSWFVVVATVCVIVCAGLLFGVW